MLRAAGAFHPKLVNLRAEIFASVGFFSVEARALANMLLASATPNVIWHFKPNHAILLPLIGAPRSLVLISANLLRIPIRWVVKIVRTAGCERRHLCRGRNSVLARQLTYDWTLSPTHRRLKDKQPATAHSPSMAKAARSNAPGWLAGWLAGMLDWLRYEYVGNLQNHLN